MDPDLKAWDLRRVEGDLLWSGCSLKEAALRFGTPLFVCSEELLARACTQLATAFAGRGLTAEFFFSFKTNPVPAVIRAMMRHGVGAEVISDFEFHLAMHLGLSPGQIVVNGSGKSPALLREAVARGVALVNLETPRQLRVLQEAAAGAGKAVNVGLRINPGLRVSPLDFTVSTASPSSHIGFLPGSEDWRSAIDLIKRDPSLCLRGIHFHLGSGIRTARPYERALSVVFDAWADLVRAGFRIEVLDIGGGFNISTLKELNLWEAVKLFAFGRSPHAPEPMHESLIGCVAGELASQVRHFCAHHRLPVPVVYVEPGRSLTGSAQLLLLRVTDIVHRPNRRSFAICDGGAMSLSLMLVSEYHTILPVGRAPNGRGRSYDIMGNLPTPLDIVALDKTLPELAPGDLLAVLDTGAYFTSLGNTFAGPRPAVAMMSGGKTMLVRRRETFEDMIARDVALAPEQQ